MDSPGLLCRDSGLATKLSDLSRIHSVVSLLGLGTLGNSSINLCVQTWGKQSPRQLLWQRPPLSGILRFSPFKGICNFLLYELALIAPFLLFQGGTQFLFKHDNLFNNHSYLLSITSSANLNSLFPLLREIGSLPFCSAFWFVLL